jgi:hypothetical protein
MADEAFRKEQEQHRFDDHIAPINRLVDRIAVRPYVERHALADINDVFDRAHHGKLVKRAVLVPG